MPAAPYVEIANQIAARLATAENIGRVYAWQRNLKSREEIESQFVDATLGRVAAWTISRDSFSDRQETNLKNVRKSTWKLRGYMGVSDSEQTEHLFQQVVDNVAAAFRPQDNLGDMVEQIEPIQANNIGYTRLGGEAGVQCHGAELTLVIEETYYS